MVVIIALTNRERVGDHPTWFQTGSALGASSQEVLHCSISEGGNMSFRRPQTVLVRAFSWIPRCTLLLAQDHALFAQTQQSSAEAKKEFFENNIRPVLVQNCATCHGDAKAWRTSAQPSRQDVLERRPRLDPAIIPGDPGQQPSDFADSPDRCGETHASRRRGAEGYRNHQYGQVGAGWCLLAWTSRSRRTRMPSSLRIRFAL